MANVKSARGVKLVLKVGDGASPEVFAAKCSINAARGITISSTTNEFPDIDCSDPDAVAFVLTEKVNLSAKITGAGIVNTPDVQDFFDWVISPDSVNCQFVLDVPSADGGVIFEGAFHLTEFAVTGDRGGKVENTISLASDGAVTCVANT
jgi:predicted secreted protein